jgi:hypothetical protein
MILNYCIYNASTDNSIIGKSCRILPIKSGLHGADFKIEKRLEKFDSFIQCEVPLTVRSYRLRVISSKQTLDGQEN